MNTLARMTTALLAGALATTTPAGDLVGWAVNAGDDTLYRVNMDTGAIVTVGTVGLDDVQGLEVVDDQLIGIGGLINEIWDLTIVPGELIGGTGVLSGTFRDLALDPTTGLLYCIASQPGNGTDLYLIDPETGQQTHIGQHLGPQRPDAMAINASGDAFALSAFFSNQLYSVDLDTAAVTAIGPHGIGGDIELAGMTFFGDDLYAVVGPNIWLIDTATGAATLAASFDDPTLNFTSLAVAPIGCPCDLNEDLVIDIVDLLAVLGNWDEAGGDCNGDGTTDITDLLGVLGSWGPCCP